MALRTLYRVDPTWPEVFSHFKTNAEASFKLNKEKVQKEALLHTEQISHLQRLLYAQHKHKILVLFQGMDTSGKDGTIRRVFHGVDPLGIRATSFKAPSKLELDHDYLWRIHQNVPAKGDIAVFNRSHYEDLITVRVMNLAPQSVWEKRAGHINDFERMLSDEGCIVLKFFLSISPEEQKKRLIKRINQRDKQWKFEESDIEMRKYWEEYKIAYSDAMLQTSTTHAPWYVIPADNKWFSDWLVSGIIVEALTHLDMDYPVIDFDPSTIIVE